MFEPENMLLGGSPLKRPIGYVNEKIVCTVLSKENLRYNIVKITKEDQRAKITTFIHLS